MPNGVRRNNNTRHSNRHRQQQEPPVIIAEVFDSRVIVQGEEVDVDEITELRREIQRLKQFIKKEEKDNTKILKQSGNKLEELFDKLKKEIDIKDKLANSLCQYESIIQYFEDEGMIQFNNQTNGRRLAHERTLKNMNFIFVHDKDGKEIPFKQIHIVLQEQSNQNEKLKKLCHQLIKQSLPNGGSMEIVKEPNKEVEVSINHDDSGEISGEVKDTLTVGNLHKRWTWKGVDYRIDVDNKQVFDMDGKQVGETVGKIPTLWDKWWEELD